MDTGHLVKKRRKKNIETNSGETPLGTLSGFFISTVNKTMGKTPTENDEGCSRKKKKECQESGSCVWSRWCKRKKITPRGRWKKNTREKGGTKKKGTTGSTKKKRTTRKKGTSVKRRASKKKRTTKKKGGSRKGPTVEGGRHERASSRKLHHGLARVKTYIRHKLDHPSEIEEGDLEKVAGELDDVLEQYNEAVSQKYDESSSWYR